MNIFKAVLFAGMVLASQATAQTFVRFHSGVNLSVAPGGSDRSAAPLDVQEATNARRVAEAADIGFDFIRLRVSLALWTDTGSTADKQRGLTLANGITQQALAYGMRVDVVMMAGSLSTTTAAGLICTANPSAVAAWTAGWQAVLALLPAILDTPSRRSRRCRLPRCTSTSKRRAASISSRSAGSQSDGAAA